MRKARKAVVGIAVTVAFVIVVAVVAVAFVRFHAVFGGDPDAASQARIEASPQFDGTRFNNTEPTEIDTPEGEPPGMLTWLYSRVRPPPGKHPGEPLPSERLAADRLSDGQMAWLGHSTVIFHMAGQTIVTDPVFYRASPIPLGGKAFPMQVPPAVEDMPYVDAVLISHDHYDHLDYRAIQEMDAKVGHYFVPLGVKAHLQRWGIADDRITEMDWHERATLGSVELIMAPARHFSGRKLSNRFSTLWSSWVVRSPGWSLYFNGDSGHGAHFAEIGSRYGPFDIALVENGAYNENWAKIHMHPEQAARAGTELRAQVVMPVHWAKFDLAYHTWKEPIERFLAAAEGHAFRTATPRIGQVFHHAEPPRERWWDGDRDSRQETGMWMTVGEQRFAITLDDTATAWALSALLPLTLDMKELHGNEKYASLPKALPTKAERAGQIRAGDLMLFGKDTLVVFYVALEPGYSYTRIGRVDDPDGLADALGRVGVRVTFSRR